MNSFGSDLLDRGPAFGRATINRSRVLLLALLALGACAKPGVRPESGTAFDGQWLVGGWVLKGESCNSDGGVVYRRDGSWVAEGASGNWRVQRGRLLLSITAQGDEKPTALAKPIDHIETVQILGPDEYVARRADGSARTMRRCP